MNKDLIKYLSSFATEERVELFHKVLSLRTSYLTVVLEDIYQAQNASAVLRSCDCFGIQNVHVIENSNEFRVDREVALGASKWLSIHKYNKRENNSREAVKALKKQGYRVIATTPHNNDLLLPDFEIEGGRAAIVFGSELPGISDIIKEEADGFLKIPMFGFTESFNISVSAAVVLYELTGKLRTMSKEFWQLTEDEYDNTMLQWLRSSIKKSKLLEAQFLKEYGKNSSERS